MADFSIKATELSEAQGKGANVVAGAETPNTGVNPTYGIISNVADVFAKGLQQDRKAEAEKKKNAVLSSYVKEETMINEAITTGGISPAAAASRSRANFNKYAAGFSEYITDFEAAGKALRGFTEKGEVESQLQLEKDIRKKDIDLAVGRGYTFIPGMSKPQEDSQIEAAKTAIRAEQNLAAFYKAADEKRADGKYTKEQEAQELKKLAGETVNMLAGSSITAFQSFTSSVSDQVRTGKMTTEAGQLQLAGRFTSINGALQAAANENPELAAPYRSLFNELNDVAKKLIDPKVAAEDAKSAFDLIINKGKLLAVTTNPKVKAAVITSQLLPNSVELALQMSPHVMETFTMLSSTPVDSGTFVPTAIGDPDTEKDFLKLTQKAISGVDNPAIKDKAAALQQATNVVNQTLKQTSELLSKGQVNPSQLKDLAAYYASSEFGNFAAKGTISPTAMQAAEKVFEITYTPTISKGVTQKLQQSFAGPNIPVVGIPTPSTAAGAPTAPTVAPKPLQDYVEVKFTGSGISFGPKGGVNGSLEVRQANALAINELKGAEKAVNQLIHIGTHMEGSTNYAKHWEENKHLYMPSVYAPPKRKEGDAAAAGGSAVETPTAYSNTKEDRVTALENEIKRTNTRPAWISEAAWKAQREILMSELNTVSNE